METGRGDDWPSLPAKASTRLTLPSAGRAGAAGPGPGPRVAGIPLVPATRHEAAGGSRECQRGCGACFSSRNTGHGPARRAARACSAQGPTHLGSRGRRASLTCSPRPHQHWAPPPPSALLLARRRPGSHLGPSPRASAPAGRLPATLPTQPSSPLRALTSAPPFQLHIFLTSFLRSAPPGFSGWFPHCGGGGSRPMALWGPSRDCLSLCFFFNSLSCV